MAGAACKVIINMGVKALTEAVEKILLDPNIHQSRMPDNVRLGLIQALADNDLAAYYGYGSPRGGLSGIVLELERYGLVTDEVWKVYKRPEFANQIKPKDKSKGEGL